MNKQAFTLAEILIAIFMIILVFMIVTYADYFTQIFKAKDAKQKTDLNTLQRALEEYHVDHGVYPSVADLTYDNMSDTTHAGKLCGLEHGSTLMQNYINELPCHDSSPSEDYIYFVEKNQKEYAIFTNLQNTSDPDISIICDNGCSYYLNYGNPGSSISNNFYNYFVASPGYGYTECYGSKDFTASYPNRRSANAACQNCDNYSCTSGYVRLYCKPLWCKDQWHE